MHRDYHYDYIDNHNDEDDDVDNDNDNGALRYRSISVFALILWVGVSGGVSSSLIDTDT